LSLSTANYVTRTRHDQRGAQTPPGLSHIPLSHSYHIYPITNCNITSYIVGIQIKV
jgi:hypothetical protein